MRWWWTPKKQAGGMALMGGAFALMGIFEGIEPLLRLALILFGLGLFAGFGATYCLLDDPEERDVFTLKAAARLGFLSAGLGVSLALWLMKPAWPWPVRAVPPALPLLSLFRLLLRRRREKR